MHGSPHPHAFFPAVDVPTSSLACVHRALGGCGQGWARATRAPIPPSTRSMSLLVPFLEKKVCKRNSGIPPYAVLSGPGALQSVPQQKRARAVTEPGLSRKLESLLPPGSRGATRLKKRCERALPPRCRHSHRYRTLKPPEEAGPGAGSACRKFSWRKGCWDRK